MGLTSQTPLSYQSNVMDDAQKMFIESYEKYSDAIFRHCFFRLKNNRELALDMMQETFMKTWDYVARGNIIENIRPFLYKVANNLLIDHSRGKKMFSLDEMKENKWEIRLSNKAFENIYNKIDMRLAMESIQKLDPKYKDVIIMRYIDELPVNYIAQITGETENNVSVRIHRGIQQLRKWLIKNNK